MPHWVTSLGRHPYKIRLFIAATWAFALLSQANETSLLAVELPTVRPFARATAIDGKVYCFGGGSETCDVLDEATSEWSRIKLGLSAAQLLGDAIGGKLYVLDPFSKEFVRFDPKTEELKRLTKIPTTRANSTVIAHQGKLFVIGGYTPDVDKKNCIEVYDPTTNRWSKGPPLPGFLPLDHMHSAAVLDGKLHIVGGLLQGNKDQPHWRLDGDKWVRCADPPLHTMWKTSVLAAAAGKLWLVAPITASTANRPIEVENNVFAYEPKTGQWQPKGRTPEGLPKALFAQAVIGDQIYILGGSGAKSIYTYNVSTGEWKKL